MSGLQTDIVDGLWWGTTRPPFAEGPSHAVLARAIGLSHRSGGLLCSGSPHAGLEALLGAADAVGAGSARVALVVVSDAIVPGLGTAFEARVGAGAAALVLVSHGGAAAFGPRVTRTHPYLDRYRGDRETATRDLYDARLFREEIFLPAMRELGEQLGTLEIDRWSLPDPDGRLGATLARQLGAGTPVSASVYATLGDTGAAAPILGAVGALDTAGTVGLVGYGGGRATAVSRRRPRARARCGARRQLRSPAARSVATPRCCGPGASSSRMDDPSRWASRRRAPPSCGATARCSASSGPAASDCGTISTPPSIHPHLHRVRGREARGRAAGAPRPGPDLRREPDDAAAVPAPLPVVVIDLDDGARLMVQGRRPTRAARRSATRSSLSLRRYALERGIPVYGYKAFRGRPPR